MRRFVSIRNLLVLLALTAAVACTRSVSAPVSTLPQRIVSLAPSLTETLFALHAGDRVVGVTEFCKYPPEATSRTIVGGALPKTINIELVLALKPDLVLLSADGQQPLVEELQRLGLNVRFLLTVGLEDTYRTTLALGDLLGVRARAEEIVALNRRVFAAVAERLRDRPRPRTFFYVWHEPLMTAGPETFVGELIAAAGGANVFDDVADAYPQVSHEELVNRNPELILAADYHRALLDSGTLQQQPGWSGVVAVQRQAIHLLDGQLISIPGPRIGRALLSMARVLHPETDFSDLVSLLDDSGDAQ